MATDPSAVDPSAGATTLPENLAASTVLTIRDLNAGQTTAGVCSGIGLIQPADAAGKTYANSRIGGAAYNLTVVAQ